MIRNAHTKTFAALFAAIMVVSMMAPVAGAAMASGADDVATDFDDDVEAFSFDSDGTVDNADGAIPQQSTDDVDIDEALREDFETTRSSSVDVVVRLDPADTSGVEGQEATVDALKRHAADSQQKVNRFAASTEGVEHKSGFWIANMVLLEVDPNEVPLEDIAAIEGTERLHANFEVTRTGGPDVGTDDTEGVDASSVTSGDYETTYGLDMINATEVWDGFGTQGEGAAVAVLDTGIDADHPDLDLYTEDPDDPTYPGGYMAFDEDGNQLPDQEPEDASGHGTHVSGTVAGAENPEGVDESFGVAPGIDLLHGQAIPAGGGSFAQVAGSMEWAVDDTHADIVTMSLGADGYESDMLEPSENARNAGVVLVASAGNSGDGVSGSPGNVYPNFASGAVNAAGDVASFSSGEEITTDSAYPEAPDYWPDEYVVPNAAAPGVDVLSSVPGGGYDDTYSGTSMSAPHKAGTFALMVSASGGDADREMMYDALEETAWKPDDWDEPEDEYDTRYGLGIIDAYAATELVALDSGVEGTVTDATGTAIEGATVTSDTGTSVETDENGEYTLLAASGEYTVTATGFGYEEDSETVEVPDDETFVEQDFELDDALGVELLEGQPDGIEGGDAFDIVVDVANLETYTVERDGDYTGDLTFELNGDEIEEGEPVDVGGLTDEATLTVTTETDTEGDLSLDHTFEGLGDTVEVTTGPTQVFEDFVPVAIIDDADFGDDVQDRLESELSDMYDLSLISGSEAVDAAESGEYDVYVAQNMDADIETFLEYTDDESVGVVWLDNWGSGSNAIEQKSDAVGNPASAEQSFTSPNPDFEILEDHPVFDGIGEVGDTLPIHSATFADHTWFDGYDGDVIGHIQAGGVDDGDGIAVDEDKNTMLLSTFGSSTFVDSGDFSGEADMLLGNSVAYVTPEDEEETGDEWEVVDVDPSGDFTVTPGAELAVDATVENTGDEGGTATVEFVFAGDTLATEEIELDAGEQGTVTFDVTAPEEEGEYDWYIALEDDQSDVWTLTVEDDDEAPADTTVSFGDGEFLFAPGQTDTVTMNTSADDVAGYEVFVDFDPDYVQIEGVEKADLDGSIATNIDNDNGTFAVAQAQASGVDAPDMLDVEVTFLGDHGDTAYLAFDDADSAVFASDGEIDADFEDATLTAGQLGDVNNDGEINAFDAILIQQYIAGEEPADDFYPALADVKQDGEIHVGDVIALLDMIVEGDTDADELLDEQQDATSINAHGAAVAL